MELTLPWAHRLPDYAAGDPRYGQNLVALVSMLAEGHDPLTMIDVGANVGDSAVQVLHAVPDASVICVEADEAYLDFLRINVGDDARCRIEPSLLVPDADAAVDVSAIRSGGTTRFVASSDGAPISRVTPAELRRRYHQTEALRVVKSDTDGYDVLLVPALAKEFSDLRPVLFFEFGTSMSRLAGNSPEEVWPALAALGYHDIAVWDNGGAPLFSTDLDHVAGFAAALDDDPDLVARHAYWDVAVVHRDDREGRQVIEQLMPRSR